MSLINNFIQYCYEQGWSQTIYSSIIIVNYVVQFVFLMFYCKHFGLSRRKTFLAQLIIYPVMYYLMLILAWIENGFTNWGANNIVRAFVYVPLIDLAVAKLLKIKKETLFDLSAPCMAFDQALGHTVCPFAGCCFGYPSSWGVWNPVHGDIRFPSQWLECLVALVIFVYILVYAKKKDYKTDGLCFPIFLVLFGGTRFFLEFLRDNDKLIGNISNLAFHALFMVVVGAIWLFVHAEKENEKKRKAANKQQKR